MLNRYKEIEYFSSASLTKKLVCVVAVTVKHKNSSREVKTFAILNNCSQGTFVKEALLKKLEIGGRATSISVETLNRENTFQLHTVDALQVCNCNTNSKKRCLNIPRNTPE